MKKLFLIFSLGLFLSCNDIENCDTNDEQDFMVLRFFDLATQSTKKVGFTITASDSPYQFVPFDDSTGIGLPLNPNTDQTSFLFTSDTSIFELVISYDLQLSLFDDACDPSFVFSNLDTVSYTFDSLSIPGTITNRQLDTNVEVFF